jgi:hypothetical protein
MRQEISAYKLPVVLLLSLHTISSVIAMARAQANTESTGCVLRTSLNGPGSPGWEIVKLARSACPHTPVPRTPSPAGASGRSGGRCRGRTSHEKRAGQVGCGANRWCAKRSLAFLAG